MESLTSLLEVQSLREVWIFRKFFISGVLSSAARKGSTFSEQLEFKLSGERHATPRVTAILYADRVTDSMKRRRVDWTATAPARFPRSINKSRNYPRTIVKAIESTLINASEADFQSVRWSGRDEEYTAANHRRPIARLEAEMARFQRSVFEFEKGSEYRDPEISTTGGVSCS